MSRDLAGSERANSTGATGARLKEGANINKSLTTLGKVIAGLAEQANEPKKGAKKSKDASHIPFRDSVLTWLLKDSLGGNSKTCMIAAISPADYDETLSTLRYADQAKKIKTKAVVNEDPSAKAMRELKDEVEALRQALMVYNPAEVEKITAKAKKAPAKSQPSTTTTRAPTPVINDSTPKPPVVFTDSSGKITQLTKDEMVEQLQTTEKLLGELNQTWEEKLENTEKIHQVREDTLKNLGITVEKNQVGLYTPKEIPYLINLNEDPLMSECLMYNIKPGITHVDQFVENGETTSKRSDGVYVIRLSGDSIGENHCRFENVNEIVTLYPTEGRTTMVNGQCISEPKKLKSGYRIILGDYHIFRFTNPGEAKKERESMIIAESISRPESRGSPSPIPSNGEGAESTSAPEVMDWNYAVNEAVIKTYMKDPKLNSITDQDLQKLFEEVTRVRIIRKRQSAGSDSLSRRTSSSSAQPSVYSSSSAFMEDDGYYTTDSSTTIYSLAGDESMYMDSKQAREYQQQRRKYEARLRRLSHRISSGSANLSTAETAIGKKVIAHWRQKRNVTMAQVILRNDIYVQQANQLAMESNKDVFYQFAIVYQDDIAFNSKWVKEASHQQCVVDPILLKERKPCVAIQVLDYKNQSTYVWSIEKFVTRLRHLQGTSFVTDSKDHLIGEDLFFNANVSPYVLVGLAKIPLKNLATQVPVQSSVSVHCKNTGRLMGQLTVDISPVARSVRNPTSDEASSMPPTSEDENPRDLLHTGQQLVCEVSILEMTGLDPRLFTSVCAQFRLSNFGKHLGLVHCSETKVNEVDGRPIQLYLHQMLSLSVTEELLSIIHNEEILFEVYGQPQEAYLNSLKLSTPQKSLDRAEMLPPKKSQDVMTSIQICEITPEGDYKPVPVECSEDYGVFSLQQGQQRRLVLSLDDTTTDPELKLERIIDVKLGQVRLVDAKGKTLEAPESAQSEIHLKSIDAKRHSDQTTNESKLKIECSWDSSLHDTLLLNAVTQSSHKVLLNLNWTVRNASQQEFKLTKEIAVNIKDQSKAATMKKKRAASQNKRGSLLNFFSRSGQQIKNNVSCIYVVEHHAELFGIQDIGKQDLPSRILNEYEENRKKMLYREQVESIRYRLYLNDCLDRMCENLPIPAIPDLEAVLKLWMMTERKETIPEKALATTMVNPPVRKWTPHVHQILMNDRTIAKRGYLQRKNDIEGKELEKLWCVLVGNYMFMYEDQSEVNEIDVIHIRNVHKEDGNTMKSKTFFTINTPHASHKFQAQDNATMLKWVDTIDKLSHYG
ncbi:hypothetical protein G6F56_001181 [Rhizopus delemar]|nr:hypothetical protein G6F56_001181 [Rhizopus delemar]